MTKKPPNPYYWVSFQCLLTLFIASLCWGIFNSEVALATLVGGLISCFSNLIFAGWFFSAPGFARKSKQMLSLFYAAEGLKIFFTAVLFAISILYLHLPFLPVLVSYLIIHLSFSFIGLYLY